MSINKPKVYIRADGDGRIGLGHVIRCCALANMLRNNFECFFFIRKPSFYLKQEIAKAGAYCIELPCDVSYENEAISWSERLAGNEIVVLDGYSFNTVYQQSIKNKGCRLICIDDIHTYPFLADVIINHAGSSTVCNYISEQHTQYFLGYKYSLLRKEFFKRRNAEPEKDVLLICLGGADPRNDTLKVWKKAQEIAFSRINIIVGAAYKFKNDLEAAIVKCKVPTTIHQSLDAEEMANMMQVCSYAVLSPSSISVEYMINGGGVFLIQIADNQKHIKKYLIEQGLAKDFSELSILSEKDLIALADKQHRFIDGKSPVRLLQIFEGVDLLNKTKVRKALSSDLDSTFEWANDPISRQMSYSQSPISYDEHRNWFLSKVSDPNSHYYIFQVGSFAYAQIRFDEKEESVVLSYSISQEYRGRGLGSFILSEGIRQFRKDVSSIKTIVGYVKKENISSCLSFEKMKFSKDDTTDYINSFKYSLGF